VSNQFKNPLWLHNFLLKEQNS